MWADIRYNWINVTYVDQKLNNVSSTAGDRGSTVVCYKSEGRWFDPSWCQWTFHWHKILPIALWPWGQLILQQKWVPGVFPGGKGGRCVGLTTYHHTAPLSWNLGTLTSWNSLGLSRPVMGLLYLTFFHSSHELHSQWVGIYYWFCKVLLTYATKLYGWAEWIT